MNRAAIDVNVDDLNQVIACFRVFRADVVGSEKYPYANKGVVRLVIEHDAIPDGAKVVVAHIRHHPSQPAIIFEEIE